MSARCHGPDELTNASTVLKLHGSFQSGLYFGVGGSRGGIESFDPIALQWKGG
jgi:hypothetical protein